MMRATAVALTLLAGCTQTHTLMELDGDIPEGVDARIIRPRRDAGPRDAGMPITPTGRCVRAAPVDLLFVIDNSNSMTEEQASLAEQIPRIVSTLVDPPDRDRDGEPDWLPVTDMHVGVVTTDMGTGGFRVPTCVEPNFGDDGILRTEGNTAIAGCMATYPPFLSFGLGADPMAFATDVTCVARMGTGGCGFEQQLDAMLKAVTPSTSGITFVMGTVGHGDRENVGFVRRNSLLAVIMLTDEEDCSASDPALFDPMSSTYTGDLNLRCFMHPAAVHRVERFADGLRALRAERPDLFMLNLIVGIPTSLNEAGARGDYAEILEHPEMQERVDTGSPTPRLVPSCNVPGRGIAFPPRRLVQLAAQFPEQSIVQSICQSDYTPAVTNILQRVGGRACAMYE
jgi:hypothetical protein